MADGGDSLRAGALPAPQQTVSTITAEHDPMVKIYLMETDGTRSVKWNWEIKRSALVEHSGFFRAMFRNECKESIENVVELHDDNALALDYIMIACIPTGTYENWDTGPFTELSWHELEHLLEICTKYDMESFKRGIFRAAHEIWLGPYSFIRGVRLPARCSYTGHVCERDWIGNTANILEANLGRYPEELYPAFAFAWVTFQGTTEKTPLMDACMEIDPQLCLGVAKACRHLAFKFTKKLGLKDRQDWTGMWDDEGETVQRDAQA